MVIGELTSMFKVYCKIVKLNNHVGFFHAK